MSKVRGQNQKAKDSSAFFFNMLVFSRKCDGLNRGKAPFWHNNNLPLQHHDYYRSPVAYIYHELGTSCPRGWGTIPGL